MSGSAIKCTYDSCFHVMDTIPAVIEVALDCSQVSDCSLGCPSLPWIFG